MAKFSVWKTGECAECGAECNGDEPLYRYTCPECRRDGCPECMLGGRGALCLECEDEAEDDEA